MSYRVRFNPEAREDQRRLYAFLLRKDVAAARRALDAIRNSVRFLESSPYSCRKAGDGDDPFLRENIIDFGAAGYVALFRIFEEEKVVRVLTIRHQREEDYL